MSRKVTRRTLLAGAAAGLFLSPSTPAFLVADEKEKRPFKIGVCDWSIGRHQNVAALELAEQVGLDGVQVSFDGGPKFDLRQETVRQEYLAAAKKHHVEICSLAMGVLNSVPYATDPRTQRWVDESIDVMQKDRRPHGSAGLLHPW